MGRTPIIRDGERYGAKIELLSVDLLESERRTVDAIANLAALLNIGLGWHYLLDLAWLYRELRPQPGMTVLDAGAGTGILQWFLAEHGVNVLSIDRNDRGNLPWILQRRYRIEGVPRDGILRVPEISHSAQTAGRRVIRLLRHLAKQVPRRLIERVSRKAPGTVTFLQGNLADLESIGDGTIDAVVSVSALEHNELEAIPDVVSSLCRVLKPAGVFLATMAASGDVDWYHEPSQGWVLTPQTIRSLFVVPDAEVIGFEDYDESLRQLFLCEELKNGLAAFYFASGENGMPWGDWCPRYVPVAVSLMKGSQREDARPC